MIEHSAPWIDARGVEAALSSLRAGEVCDWKASARLAGSLRDRSGEACARLFASGSLALSGALRLLNLKPASKVAIPAYTCVDVMRAVEDAGLRPLIVDCDADGLLDAASLRSAMSREPVAAAIAVHQFGLLNKALESFCSSIPVLEDCSHVAPKRHLKGSFAACGSMNGLKLLGSAEGGYMVGGAELAAGALPGERLSDLIAVLALRSLETLDANLARRSALARTYRSATKLDVVDSPERAAWFRFIVRLSGPDAIERFIVDAGKSGIVVRRPIMPHPLDGYLKPGGDASAPVAWRLWESFASVPLYPALSDEDARVVEGFLHGWS